MVPDVFQPSGPEAPLRSLLDRETPVPLSQVPRLLPPAPTGKRVHLSTVTRWRTRGVGGVVLEAERSGRTWYTTREALTRFRIRLTAAATRPAGCELTPLPAGGNSPTQEGRERTPEEIEELLRREGF